jgi:response regulator RpfG family c-di-GMP phosphodiesterase
VNLDFGLLWIEDSFNPEEEENLRRRIRQAGFLARIKNISNSNGIEDLAKEHKLFHTYDLILLDYKLQDEDGNEIAPKIRSLFPSTTILFYSGSVGEEDLRLLIAEKNVEGVYCSARTRFIERTGELIDQTARALDRLSGMRGLSMRVVSECDAIMKQSMLLMCERDNTCAERVQELDKDVLEHMDEMKNKYTKTQAGTLQDRFDSRAVDSAKLHKHFRRLTETATKQPDIFGLSHEQVDRLRELRKQTAQYDIKVLRKRNILGHVVEVKSDKGWALNDTSEITIQDFPEIRQIFATHIDAFREIGKIVVRLDD